MKLTAREAVRRMIKGGVNLAGVERVLELPQKSLKSIYEEEGPATAEIEALLNMVIAYPWLLTVAQENFNLKKLVVELFSEWRESQNKLLQHLEKR